MPEKLILFDIPDRNGTCWSLNPWKTRLTLNYKGIDYKTEWLEYPDMGPRLKPTGLEGDPDQIKPYTCPTVQFPDVSYTDFVFVGFLHFVKRAGEEHYQRVVQHSESFDKIYKACEKWLERNDH
ncbi:hypothetical protein CNYM01_04547 [Colletotrichum nymphaeae SA-01]|uniref:GST N-terminal domain-containing protein n=1 Tax=Colletotrichum nymphaeae SA-01 TaxID=1460502 RepID=A0A135RWQ2_9PEZI|nr:hypothetical protein CNYM01_04547 [Colletotrichum nymphaeae SA-01]